MRKNNKMPWIDERRLKDPLLWFMKASAYCSASLYILEEWTKLRSGDEISHVINSINATPYLTCLAAELYMKGYLVFKGERPNDLKRIRHDLGCLRRMCSEYGDSRFISNSLIFLTDTLGDHIMEDGGIRYPHHKERPIYSTVFEEALNILRRITRDVENEIADKEE